MAHKTLINGTAYEISGGRTLVNGTGYAIGKGKTLVSGTAYEVGFGTAIGSLPLGTTVPLKINGSSRDFIIVHQGLPSSVYDNSCNGTWLLMKDCHESFRSDSTNWTYESTGIHSYLNNTFISLFDTDVKSAIKQVKIPYGIGQSYGDTSVASGSNGLVTKAFLLSYTETGVTGAASTIVNALPIEGVVLDYFNGASNSKRVATFNGSSVYWFTRTLNKHDDNSVAIVNKKGVYANMATNASTTGYLRPAFILPSEFEI